MALSYPMTRPLAAACICLAAAAHDPLPAEAQGGQLTVLVGGHSVFATVDAPADEDRPLVYATLHGQSGVAKAEAAAPASQGGATRLAFRTRGTGRSRPVIIAPGDRIEVRLADTPNANLVATAVAPQLTAAADPALARVMGLAPPGEEVSVTARDTAGGFGSARVTAGQDGSWMADFAGRVSFEPGTRGAALLAGGDHVFQVDWVVAGAQLAVGANPVLLWAPADTEVTAKRSGCGPEVEAYAIVGEIPIENADAGLWFANPNGTSRPWDCGTLNVEIGGKEVEVTAVPVSARVDADADTVAGTAEAGTTLAVTYRQATAEVVVGADGRWVADLSGEVDVVAGEAVSITIPGPTPIRMTAHAPGVTGADPFVGRIHVRGTAAEPVEIVHQSAQGTEKGRGQARLGADGTATVVARDDGGQATQVVDGDTMAVVLGDEASQTIWQSQVPLWHPRVTADAGDDVVRIVAGPDAHVAVTADGVETTARHDGDSAWSADFDSLLDIEAGTEVVVTVTPAGGPPTTLEFTVFRASAQVGTPRVRVEGHPDLQARAELERDGVVVAAGECIVSRSTCKLDLADSDGTPIAMGEGDSLLVFPSAGATALLAIVGLTAHIDLSGRDVVGQGPVESPVAIEFDAPGWIHPPARTTTGTDSNGVYDYELARSEWGLLAAGVGANVYYRLPGGHRVFARGVVEQVVAEPWSAEVHGLAEPGAPVSATLHLGEAAVAVGLATADADGRYELTLSANGSPVAAAPGHRLVVEHRRRSHVLPIAAVGGWVIDGAGALTGFAPELLTVTARFAPREDDVGGPVPSVTGLAFPGGTFYLPEPRVDRAQVGAVTLAVILPGGDELTAPVDQAARLVRLFVPAAGMAR